MRVLYGSLVCLSVLCLSACGSAQIQNSPEFASAQRDCREPANLFDENQFTVRVTNASWNDRSKTGARAQPPPSAGAGFTRFTIDLVYQNITKAPLALSNAGNGIMYTPEYALISDDGTRYLSDPMASAQASMQGGAGYAAIMPMQNINPGASQNTKLVFEVPKGNYTMSIERQVQQSMLVVPVARTSAASMRCRLNT